VSHRARAIPEATVRRSRRRRGGLLGVAPWVYVAVAAIIVLPPVAWTVSTSLKLEADTIKFPPEWIPAPLSLGGYAELLNSTNIQFFVNSLLYAAGCILLSLAVCLPAAYVATRHRSRGMGMLMDGILVLSMVPAIVVSYPLLILVYTAIISGQVILFLRNFIENVPVEIEEAAAIDGCSRLQVLRWIVVPLILPGIAAISIFIFVFVWNDYLVGTVLATTDNMKTMQNGIVRYLQTGFGVIWAAFCAFVVVAFAPVLGLFSAFQRWFIAGMTSGGVKG
jgi:multiple sugar transport system permease protein